MSSLKMEVSHDCPTKEPLWTIIREFQHGDKGVILLTCSNCRMDLLAIHQIFDNDLNLIKYEISDEPKGAANKVVKNMSNNDVEEYFEDSDDIFDKIFKN